MSPFEKFTRTASLWKFDAKPQFLENFLRSATPWKIDLKVSPSEIWEHPKLYAKLRPYFQDGKDPTKVEIYILIQKWPVTSSSKAQHYKIFYRIILPPPAVCGTRLQSNPISWMGQTFSRLFPFTMHIPTQTPYGPPALAVVHLMAKDASDNVGYQRQTLLNSYLCKNIDFRLFLLSFFYYFFFYFTTQSSSSSSAGNM